MTRHVDQPPTAQGPSSSLQRNPRYFTIVSGEGAGRAVYLAGSHIWNNLHDGMGPGAGCSEEPERFDFPAYLDFEEARGHNFIRLWRWEQFRSQAAGGDFHLCMAPQPWARTGPGVAKDDKPRFRPHSVRSRVLRPARSLTWIGLGVGVVLVIIAGLVPTSWSVSSRPSVSKSTSTPWRPRSAERHFHHSLLR
jgi:hypothetical protein